MKVQLTKALRDLLMQQKRGVLGTNAELREIQGTLSDKGLGITARDPKNFVEAVAGAEAEP